MLLKQMKYFISVVECNSFTEAAEQCYISQSAISQQIKALEQELGVDLIKRNNRQFTLTPAGEYFYRHGVELVSEIDNLKRETVRRGQDQELSLKIGYLRCYGAQELHHVIAKFSKTYSEVSLSIVNQNTLGFANQFLFADTLEEGRLMVVSNRGFMPIEAVGTLPPPATGITRIPLYHHHKPLQRNYCAFWHKEKTNYYIEEFAELLRNLLNND